MSHLSDLTTPYQKRPSLQKRIIQNITSSEEKEVWDTMTVRNSKGEIPYFWDVHFSGESVAEQVFSSCHGLVQAAEHGLLQPNYNDEDLEVFQTENGKFVNVDTATDEGLKRASKLNLAKSGLADIITSSSPHPIANQIFTPNNPGRMFTILRHPVDRAVTMYYYLKTATWDPLYNPKLITMSLVDYAKSSSIENNWLTRFLVNKPGGALTKKDLILAKELLKRKCLVGLYDDMEVSLAKFDRYFGWTDGNSIDQDGEDGDENDSNDKDEETNKKRRTAAKAAASSSSSLAKTTTKTEIQKCRKKVINTGDYRHNHPDVKEGSKEWNLIIQQNRFDMELYNYAKLLYQVQGEQIFGIV
mmetsp:Transcript_6181/g.9062  ORF Transcript_6181/g.9062 Transcript_6181/m.9062 type:complete len:358 (-) Transcript_6181:237-1310(-)